MSGQTTSGQNQAGTFVGHVLFISYYFPPVATIGAMRPWHLAQEFHRRGYQVTVITSALAGKTELNVVGFKVHHIEAFDSRWVSKVLKRKQKRHPISSSSQTASRSTGARALLESAVRRSLVLRRLLDSFPMSVLAGEGGILFAVRALMTAFQEPSPTVIFSSSAPMIDHLLARGVRRFRGGTWVSDFEDPLVDSLLTTGSSSPSAFDKRQGALTWRAIGRPTMATAVSEGVLEVIQLPVPKLAVLQGLSQFVRAANRPQGNEFKMVYTGSIYPDRQSIEPLCVEWRKLIDSANPGAVHARLVYAGPHGKYLLEELTKFNLEHQFDDLGVITHKESLDLQSLSDANVMLTWSHPGRRGVLTGKLFEYLPAKRPIVCLVNGDHDPEIEKFFSKDPNLLCVFGGLPDSVTRLRNTLGGWMSDVHLSSQHPQEISQSFLDSLSWERQTNELFQRLEQLDRRHSQP
jgi:hypothetical protein